MVRRTTRSRGGNLVPGLPNTPVPRSVQRHGGRLNGNSRSGDGNERDNADVPQEEVDAAPLIENERKRIEDKMKDLQDQLDALNRNGREGEQDADNRTQDQRDDNTNGTPNEPIVISEDGKHDGEELLPSQLGLNTAMNPAAATSIAVLTGDEATSNSERISSGFLDAFDNRLSPITPLSNNDAMKQLVREQVKAYMSESNSQYALNASNVSQVITIDHASLAKGIGEAITSSSHQQLKVDTMKSGKTGVWYVLEYLSTIHHAYKPKYDSCFQVFKKNCRHVSQAVAICEDMKAHEFDHEKTWRDVCKQVLAKVCKTRWFLDIQDCIMNSKPMDGKNISFVKEYIEKRFAFHVFAKEFITAGDEEINKMYFVSTSDTVKKDFLLKCIPNTLKGSVEIITSASTEPVNYDTVVKVLESLQKVSTEESETTVVAASRVSPTKNALGFDTKTHPDFFRGDRATTNKRRFSNRNKDQTYAKSRSYNFPRDDSQRHKQSYRRPTTRYYQDDRDARDRKRERDHRDRMDDERVPKRRNRMNDHRQKRLN